MARSCGRDRRWSPSGISDRVTSSAGSRLASFSAWLVRHVGIGHALQDVDRAVRVDRPGHDAVLAARPRSAPACRCWARPNSRTAPRNSPCRRAPRFCASVSAGSISSAVKSGAGASSTSPAMRPPSPALRSSSTMLQRDPGAHRRADQDLRPVVKRRNTARLSPSQREIVPSRNAPPGLAMAGIVVAQKGAALVAPAQAASASALVPLMSER